VATLVIFGGLSVPVANSIQEDRIVVGDLRTVGRPAPYGGAGCGGALIAPRIVYTAAHCVARRLKSDINASTNGVPITSGVIPENLSDIYVTFPGVDISLNPEKKGKGYCTICITIV
jgi:hypothetical protein